MKSSLKKQSHGLCAPEQVPSAMKPMTAQLHAYPRGAGAEKHHLTGADLLGGSGLLTTGILAALGEGTLELGSGDGVGGCPGGVDRGTVLTAVLAGLRGASGGCRSLDAQASSRTARAGGFGMLLRTGAFLVGLGGWRAGGLLGAFLITAGKGGERGR